MSLNKIKKKFEQLLKLSPKFHEALNEFHKMVEEEYGYVYNDKDLDEIIDCIEYGHANLSFDQFHQIMLNNKEKSE